MKKIIDWYLQGDELDRIDRLVQIAIYSIGVFAVGYLVAGY